jgi:hypothetical protein
MWWEFRTAFTRSPAKVSGEILPANKGQGAGKTSYSRLLSVLREKVKESKERGFSGIISANNSE